jgi:alpha-N-arabinofuranosidase
MAQKLAFGPFRSIQCRILRRSRARRTFLLAFQAESRLVRSLCASLTLLVVAMAVPVAVAQKIQLSVDVSRAGAKIDRNLFGQFAEHLGHGVYERIWVGPDSKIPNTRGIRNDVVASLKAIKVPNVRWPGGCFADEYHWRKGIGQQRTVTLNPN